MSTFTRFSAEEQLRYDKTASVLNNKDIWDTIPGFRYYIGEENSTRYVDVETNFKTDGATIPRWLWWLLPPIGEYTQCTTLHDKLCTTYYITQVVNGVETRVRITRKQIDAILKESMDVMNITPWKKTVIMTGVNAYRLVKNPTAPKPVALAA
jgi:Protein of unknown function (DUF1353).